MSVTKENLEKWLEIFGDLIETNKAYLSDLDTPIGDGDHGNNMARGMAAVKETLASKQPEDIVGVFKVTAMSLISKVGGASGPLYGTAFLEMAKASAKTMVDVWTVLVPKLKDNSLTQADIDAAVESTKDMVAKKGRASYLGERSVGHLDPGAVSSGYLFTALLEAGVM